MRKSRTLAPSRQTLGPQPSPLRLRPLPDATLIVLILVFVAVVPVILAAILTRP